MKPLRVLGWYFAIVFVGGSLVAPWVFKLIQQLAEHSTAFPDVFTRLAHHPFHRYVRRCFYLLALLGLVPLIRAAGMTSLGDLGWRQPRLGMPNLGLGFVIGFFSLATVAVIAIAFNAVVPDLSHAARSQFQVLVRAMSAAAIVAPLEELLFRGVLFGILRKSLAPSLAMVVSSMIFSLVHFFAKPATPPVIEWYTGLQTLMQMCGGFANGTMAIPSLLGLTVAGIILSWAYHRTGTLWFSIGLHAGWIFWLKAYRNLVDSAPGASPRIWGSDVLHDGWITVAVLVGTGFVVRWCLSRKVDRTG